MKLFSVALENDEFHKRLGGGIPYGTLAFILGESGSGKSVVCQRIAYGLLKNGFKVTYVSTQLTTIEFVKQMSSLSYDVVKSIVKRNLLFIPVYPLLGDRKMVDDYLEKVMQAEELFENDVVIIDSFTTLVRYDRNKELLRDVMSFFKRLTALNRAIILTGSKEIEDSLIRIIENACTFLAETNVKKLGTDLKNVMTIKKYNLALGSYSKQIAFRVEAGIGLVVEIAAIA